ncbi:MAG: hypothetical protein HC895_03045 [Leptolyngbyaceae cyanobacterium SM1_3_5]|nr:hypothetical protein [Leptolyngbyaceae cyanobacterium SM1_3_5]
MRRNEKEFDTRQPRKSPKQEDRGIDVAAIPTESKRRSNRSKSPEIEAEKAQIKQQVTQAIEEVKRYNQYIDKTQQPHRLKREVTVNFLKAITKSQGQLSSILADHQTELNEHYAQMRIKPGHNTTYREKITLDTIRQILQAAAVEGKS